MAGRTGCAASAAPQVEQGSVSCGDLGNGDGQRGGLCIHPFAVGCRLTGLTAGVVAMAVRILEQNRLPLLIGMNSLLYLIQQKNQTTQGEPT